MELKRKWKSGVWGKQESNHKGKRGRACGYTLTGNIKKDKIAFAATIRAAAPHQKYGDFQTDFQGQDNLPKVSIRTSDIRYQRLTGKERMGILFVVDASRSQGADRRLAFAKGAVLSLLRQVYTRRDKAGLIIFGKSKAELVLPFTKSVEYAGKKLASLPASGNTPLAMGLRKALEMIELEQKRDAFLNPLLVVITDGKANYDTEKGQPFELAMEAAGVIRESGIPAVVIDTEKGVFRLGLARRLADQLHARYLTLE